MASNILGLGGIILNFDGEVIVFIRSGHNFSMPLVVAEVMTLRRVMILCLTLGLNHVIFEGDCKQII